MTLVRFEVTDGDSTTAVDCDRPCGDKLCREVKHVPCGERTNFEAIGCSCFSCCTATDGAVLTANALESSLTGLLNGERRVRVSMDDDGVTYHVEVYGTEDGNVESSQAEVDAAVALRNEVEGLDLSTSLSMPVLVENLRIVLEPREAALASVAKAAMASCTVRSGREDRAMLGATAAEPSWRREAAAAVAGGGRRQSGGAAAPWDEDAPQKTVSVRV